MCKKQKATKSLKMGHPQNWKKRLSSKLSWIWKIQHLLILLGSHIFSLSLILSKMYRLVSRLVQTCLDLSRHVLTLYYYCDLNKHRKKIVHHWNSGNLGILIPVCHQHQLLSALISEKKCGLYKFFWKNMLVIKKCLCDAYIQPSSR